jgi:hypothetical protein
VLVLLLAACGSGLAGNALVVGSSTVSDSEVAAVTDEVRDIYSAYPKEFAAAGASFDEGAVVSSNVNRMTRHLLLVEAASREGITVTQGQIDEAIRNAVDNQFGGDETQLDIALAAQQQVPPSAKSDVVYDFLVGAALAEKLNPAEPTTGEVDTYLADLGAELGAEVAPRFGVWNPETAALTPVSDDLSVLAPLPSE